MWDPNIDPADVLNGVEFAIPLAAIGNPTGCFRITAFINGRYHDWVSNQMLPPLPPGTGNLEEPRNVNLAALTGEQNVIICIDNVSRVPEEAPSPPVAAALTLAPPSPNPFRATTTVQFTLDQPAAVTAQVYDVTGRLVRRLESGHLFTAGTHATQWDGRDDAGGRAASGIYFMRVSAAGMTRARTIVLQP